MHKVKNLGPGGEDVYSCAGRKNWGCCEGQWCWSQYDDGVSLWEATSISWGACYFKQCLFTVIVTKLLGQFSKCWCHLNPQYLLHLIVEFGGCIFILRSPLIHLLPPCINMLCMYLYLYLRLYLYIYCILIIFHVTSYVVVWMITLRQLLIFSYFILLKWLHDEVHMMMKWSEWIRWGELIKSAYIQLKQLEDTWAFLPSLSLQLIGYCVRLKMYVPKPGPWGVMHINKWAYGPVGQCSIHTTVYIRW